MDTDKAYLLGLIIGGGVFGNAEDVFSIRLPYKKWGSYLANPQRAGEIAGDILRKVGQDVFSRDAEAAGRDDGYKILFGQAGREQGGIL